jgi:fatty-acyl-CoA synthase
MEVGVSARLSYACGLADEPLLGDTIGVNLAGTVAAFGEREALVECRTGRRWTYRQLAAEVDAVALGLLELGVGKGDRVGIWAPNCAEWVFVQYATAKIGAIQVNINPGYRVPELSYVLNQSGVRTLVAAREFKTSDYVAMIAEARPDCPGLRDVVLIGGQTWTELLETGRAADAGRLAEAEAGLSADDPINIQYTSGTTGFPKGATLSHHNVLNNAYFFARLAAYTEDDRLCVPVPFYHCFGMVCGNLAAATHGACVVIPAPSFEPAATLAAVAAERCTALYGVPTMLIAALNDPSFASHDLTSLRIGFTGGSPCPVEMMRQVIDRMGIRDMSIVFGMTELSPLALQTRTDDPLQARLTTAGGPVPHVEVKVIDPATGLTLPRGTAGELCVRGYAVMLGYWEQPEATAQAIDAARWMHSGDLAVMDEAGHVAITGRIKDMVIRGGENIYPREVEDFLHTHPDIVEAQVIGVPDPTFGEELMAWIRLRPGAPELTAAAMREFCTGRLAHYKIPRYVHLVDAFPLTVTGKVRKVEMRERALELLGHGALTPDT